jgi:hypothetical protein
MTDNIQEYLKSDKTNEPRPLSEAMARRRPNMAAARPADPGFENRIPLDHHFDNIAEDDTQASKKGRGALKELWDVHEALLGAATTIQNKAQLAKEAQPLVEKAIRVGKQNLDMLQRHVEHQEAELKKAYGSGLNPLASEIRAHVKALPERQRAAFVREAITSGDIESIKALFAPRVPFLAGLDRETFAELSLLADEALAPAIVAERRIAGAAWTRASKALDHFEATMTRNLKVWRDGDDQRIKNLVDSLTPKVT